MYKQELIACCLMRNAEKHKFLSGDQHGGRNGQEALEIVLRKTINFETLHLQQANFDCTHCNAKAYYNRIVPLVLLLAYLKAGLPYQYCVFLVTMLYSLQHTLIIAIGKSLFKKWHNFPVAMFGIGQGATDGPSS
eukprot:3440747-Ditylum_brightwellii.AAC.1